MGMYAIPCEIPFGFFALVQFVPVDEEKHRHGGKR